MRQILLTAILTFFSGMLLFPQEVIKITHKATAVSSPTYVNGGGDFTGGGSFTTGWSLTAGNHLVVWVGTADRAADTCSATGNTFVVDGMISSISSDNSSGHLHHVKSIAASGTLTITCTGATPLVAAIEYSGGTGDLDTASAGGTGGNAIIGTGIDSAVTSCSPGSFTPTSAATILVNGLASTTGLVISALTQTDGSYTTRASALDGSTSYVGAIGTRVVSSSTSYTDGLSWTTTITASVCMNGAYK